MKLNAIVCFNLGIFPAGGVTLQQCMPIGLIRIVCRAGDVMLAMDLLHRSFTESKSH